MSKIEQIDRPAGDIANPYRWFYARRQDDEWWHMGGATREETIEKGRADYPGEQFWIEEAKRLAPGFSIFDADDICERIGEDECWGEDGWLGEPGTNPK